MEEDDVPKKIEKDYLEIARAKRIVWLGEKLHSKNGLEWKQLVPINTHVNTWWQCPHGSESETHRWRTRFSNIQHGTGCPFCAAMAKRGRSLVHKTIEHYTLLAIQRGFKWAEGQELPSNVHNPTLWVCDEHGTWTSCYNTLLQGSGCPKCAGVAAKTENDYHALAELHGFEWKKHQRLPAMFIVGHFGFARSI